MSSDRLNRTTLKDAQLNDLVFERGQWKSYKRMGFLPFQSMNVGGENGCVIKAENDPRKYEHFDFEFGVPSESTELEFVQIIIIIVVITVMVVVIICLLNHYKVSTWSFISRQSQSRRQEESLQPAAVPKI
uniref:Uncharacterized protein n=1 Tax=Sphaerodactylus townsendi TaxID=933632 RepID=A0ACB8FCP2_9SAUR